MTQHVCFSSPRKIHDSKSSFVIMKNQNVQRIPICHKVHTTFYCDFLLQTLYPYSSSFKLFFSVRKLSGKFHKSSVCLCALRGDFSPFFCYGVIGGEEAGQEEANTLELKPERHGRHVRIMLGPPM